MDCGAACLRMVAFHYGKDYCLKDLKQICNITRIGVTLSDLSEGAKKIGFDSSAAKANIQQLLTIPLPAIIVWRQEHYVVLYKISKDNKGNLVFFIADPAYGKIQINKPEFEKCWINNAEKGVIVLFSPSGKLPVVEPDLKFKNGRDERRAILNLARKTVNNNRHQFIQAFFIFFLALVSNWMLPVLFQKMIDQGVLLKDIGAVGILLAVQFMFFSGNVISDYFSSKLLLNISFNVGIKLLSDFLYKLIKLPISFFDARINTDLLQRIEDQDRIQNFITYKLIHFTFSIFNLLAFSVIILFYSPSSFFIFLIASICSVFWTFVFLERRKVLDYSRFAIQTENSNNLYEMVAGMPEIKINNAHYLRVNKWQRTQERLNKVVLKALHLNYLQIFGVNIFNKIKDIAITGLCAYFVISGEMTLGVMMSISYILGQLNGPLDQLVDFVRNAQDASLAFNRIYEINQKPEENLTYHNPVPDIIRNGIRIDKLSFKYHGSFNSFILNDINLLIPKNKVTAIVGTSGSGKTTLMKLLLGFYHPQVGAIYIDGAEISSINLDQWRSKCGVVMQDGFIFSGTVAENIALAEEKYDPERLKFAIETACLDFVYELPMGVHTNIGKIGIELSGGQKQRILIARAVYKNPDFIFFDEATSALDANNESKIMKNLNNFIFGKTVVIIAHRLSTVKNADQIIALEGGKVVEYGTHEKLIENKSYYFKLVKNQLELGN
jgi:ATP-binding cassette subfamily B protein